MSFEHGLPFLKLCSICFFLLPFGSGKEYLRMKISLMDFILLFNFIQPYWLIHGHSTHSIVSYHVSSILAFLVWLTVLAVLSLGLTKSWTLFMIASEYQKNRACWKYLLVLLYFLFFPLFETAWMKYFQYFIHYLFYYYFYLCSRSIRKD